MRVLLVFVFLTLLLTTSNLKAEQDHKDSSLNSISDSIQRFYSLSKTENLKEYEELLLNKKANSEEESLLVQYFIALINYRLGLLDYENGETYFQKCLDTNNNILSKSAEYTEAHVLTAACSNAMIRYQPEQTMALSLKSRNALDAATKIDSQNPRLLFIKGTSAVYIPPQFGGGIDEASQLFTRAITYFRTQNSTEGKQLPKWGFDEAYLWLGMLKSLSGEQGDAISALTKSLEISDNIWVKNTLIPTLKRGESIAQYFGL
ncbi:MULTISPECIES: hypothetical protein [unclassified Pseudoalteromonas]|uniref:hypothetical protein n=1 Tax=unclassified Pseudoalteromonas TaxID=194690 RepID=UPI0015FEC48F|nr:MULTISPECIES: hypothetical protein [unclassified Pseudoalteromonas]MBB1295556.1 hypothetical protein [Pseudoalteromonas sp. SR41-4]MBB1411529.1 hypothetical protein [Pseudoalteromonas sp. SG44-17]MBB1507840.1 hypothetical protein [Pseudoalteromonas sp. SG41-1]